MAGGRRNGIQGYRVLILQDQKIAGDGWQHSNVKVFTTTIQYTYK